jgi:hypothetical protein
VEQQLASSIESATLTEEDTVNIANESFDSIIHTIISKFFKLQHANENRVMEL